MSISSKKIEIDLTHTDVILSSGQRLFSKGGYLEYFRSFNI